MKRNNYTGKTFGRLLVLECAGRDKHNNALWNCQCICGASTLTSSLKLTRGYTRSCGCLQRDLASMRATTHGMSKSAEFNIWGHIKRRCFDQRTPQWDDYNGRGITMCEEWRHSFEAFFKNVGPRPTKAHTIERINNNGNYEPGNVRWATRLEQNRNTRVTRFLTHNGVTKCLGEWAEELNLNSATLGQRIDRQHWSIAEAVTTPNLGSGHQHNRKKYKNAGPAR